MSTISINVRDQIVAAYGRMADRARYRPAAPSDGLGNILVACAELVLEQEADRYARCWWQQEDDCTFWVGCCDYSTRPATIFALEAARCMCGGEPGNPTARRLLRMALAELDRDAMGPTVA